MLSFNNIDELKTVRFLNGYEYVTLDKFIEELHIQDQFEDDTREALKHLISEDDTINFPNQVPKAVAESYITHFNACIDDVLQLSVEDYEKDLNLRWRSEVLPFVINSYEQDGIPDKPARRESFNNWVDGLDIHTRIKDNVSLYDHNEIA